MYKMKALNSVVEYLEDSINNHSKSTNRLSVILVIATVIIALVGIGSRGTSINKQITPFWTRGWWGQSLDSNIGSAMTPRLSSLFTPHSQTEHENKEIFSCRSTELTPKPFLQESEGSAKLTLQLRDQQPSA